MDIRWTSLVIPMIVACASKPAQPDVKPGSSSPTAVPTPAPVEPPPIEAPPPVAGPRPKVATKPLVRDPQIKPTCGSLKTQLATELPVLADRLRITAPAGSQVIPRPWNIMGAPEPDDTETRVMVGGGKSMGRGNDEAIAIVISETWQLDPDLAKAEPGAIVQPKSFAEEAPKLLAAVYGDADIEPVAVGDPEIRAYAAWPKRVELGDRDAALVLGMIVSLPDATLQTVAFHVSPVLVKQAAGCTALAERIAASLVVGKRALARNGGPRVLEDRGWGKVSITLPKDYVVTHQAAEDFDHYHIYKLRPIGLYPGNLTVAVDSHPNRSLPAGATHSEPGTLIGDAITWQGTRAASGGFLVATRQLVERHHLQVVLRATREGKYLDEFRKVAETLAFAKK